MISLIFLMIQLPLIGVDIYMLSQAPFSGSRAYLAALLLHTLLTLCLGIFILLIFRAYRMLQSPVIRTGPGIWKSFLMFTFLSTAILSGVDQLTHGEITIYTVSCLGVSVLVLIPLKLRLALFISAFLVFTGALRVFQPDTHEFIANTINGAVMSLIGFLLSSIVYSASRDEYHNSIRFLEQKEVMEKQLKEDCLTGLFNRRFLENSLSHHYVESCRTFSPFVVSIVDVDSFKTVNDEHSHHIGDLVLKCISDILRENCRKNDRIFRYGGDEFVLILPDTTASEASVICERMRIAIMEYPWSRIEEGLTVTASFGVAESGFAESADDILKSADKKLYRAKYLGRNQVYL